LRPAAPAPRLGLPGALTARPRPAMAPSPPPGPSALRAALLLLLLAPECALGESRGPRPRPLERRRLRARLDSAPSLPPAAALLPAREATQFLRPRQRRAYQVFEEAKQGHLERECVEELCSREEAREVFENDPETVSGRRAGGMRRTRAPARLRLPPGAAPPPPASPGEAWPRGPRSPARVGRRQGRGTLRGCPGNARGQTPPRGEAGRNTTVKMQTPPLGRAGAGSRATPPERGIERAEGGKCCSCRNRAGPHAGGEGGRVAPRCQVLPGKRRVRSEARGRSLGEAGRLGPPAGAAVRTAWPLGPAGSGSC
ncbi:hypothetical protein P7K49_000024, partial [Saguinus oedipus]